MNQLKWHQTGTKGIRYRQHPTRKHGKKFDIYYAIRYQENGIRIEEGLGWASETGITLDKAVAELSKLREAAMKGEGPVRLAEKREIEDSRKAADEAEQARLEKENVTVTEYCEKTYFPWTKQNKADNTYRTEDLLFTHWVKPVIGSIPLVEVVQIDVERVKQGMFAAKKAPKTVHHTLGLIRQIYNHAKRPDIYLRAKVKMPKVDNAKLRYLTPSEIVKLLLAVKEKSVIVHDQAILAVNCGLRFSEAAGLRWEDVNYDTGSLSIRDSKTGSRTVFLNDVVADMLKSRQEEKTTGLIFPGKRKQEEKTAGVILPEKRKAGTDNDQRQLRSSKTFQRVADKLFNKDVDDRRLRVTFHTLRHSFGTHVYENSGDLYLTQKALGHRTMVMAARYAKMSETRLREAFTRMSDVMKKGRDAAKEQAEQEDQPGQVVNIQK
jgi:integrase